MHPVLLLVDDEINILRALERVFEEENYEIITVTSAKEALDVLSRQVVQVIISDQRMPVMTGAELFSEVKKLYPNTRRIILSAYADFEAVREAINEGSIYKFLNKPWDEVLLKNVVKESFLSCAQQNDKEEQYKELLQKFQALAINKASVSSFIVTEKELKKFIENNRFVVYYQPILEAKSRKIIGVEALIRLNHPKLGLLEPRDFLSLCEYTGLIIPLGDWILKTCCMQLKSWQEIGISLTLSVNVSGRQFNDSSLFDSIKNVLNDTKVSPHLLHLEITESIAIYNIETTVLLLKLLKELGVGVVLDDFGTGYSSLQYLKDLPLKILKIDKSFIQNMGTDKISFEIVDAILLLAKHLQLQVIAEGVENEMQLKLLQEKECDFVQGFLFSKALPADDVIKFFKKT